MIDGPTLPEVSTSDGELRIAEFLARHGGPAARREREGDMQLHTRGWSEVYAADGYRLRCEWSRVGGRIDMSFVEIPADGAGGRIAVSPDGRGGLDRKAGN